MKIMVVDDSAFARKRLSRVLTAAGFSVVEAENGRVALERFAEARPDVVTVDLLMPEMGWS